MKRAIRRQGLGEHLCSPKSFWSLQSQKNSSEFAKSYRRRVPCEQGAADCYPFWSSADPTLQDLGRLTYAASVNNLPSTTSLVPKFGLCAVVWPLCRSLAFVPSFDLCAVVWPGRKYSSEDQKNGGRSTRRPDGSADLINKMVSKINKKWKILL